MTCRSNNARVLRMSNDLFGGELLPPDAKSKPASRKASTQEPQPMLRPLAERMRPGTLDEVVGQTHLLGAGAPLRTAFEQHRPHSMILWGPPGVGKTTLARLMASAFDLPFISISAVLGGVKEIRDAVDAAKETMRLTGRPTLLLWMRSIDSARASRTPFCLMWSRDSSSLSARRPKIPALR